MLKRWLGYLNVVKAIKWADDKDTITVMMLIGFGFAFFMVMIFGTFINMTITAIGFRVIIVLFIIWAVPTISINKKIRKEENDTSR